jgi:hypothetical protein
MSQRPAVRRGHRIGMEMVSSTLRPMFEGPWYDVPVDFARDQTRVR